MQRFWNRQCQYLQTARQELGRAAALPMLRLPPDIFLILPRSRKQYTDTARKVTAGQLNQGESLLASLSGRAKRVGRITNLAALSLVHSPGVRSDDDYPPTQRPPPAGNKQTCAREIFITSQRPD